MDWYTIALGTDTSDGGADDGGADDGRPGPRTSGAAPQPSNTRAGLAAPRTATCNRAAAAPDMRPAAAAAAGGAAADAGVDVANGDGDVAAAVAAGGGAAADGDGPVGRPVLRPPTFVVAVAAAAAGVRVEGKTPLALVAILVAVARAAAAAAEAADRSTRDGSTWAVRRKARTAVRPAVVGDGTTMVCDGTANFGCDGSNRVDGADRPADTPRTGWLVPGGSGPVLAVVAAAGTGGWPKPAATGSTTAAAAVVDDMGPVVDNGRNRAASVPTSI